MTDVPNLRQQGTRLGNWLTRDQAKELLAVPDRSTIKGKRDYCIWFQVSEVVFTNVLVLAKA
jgi:hypothetical protein